MSRYLSWLITSSAVIFMLVIGVLAIDDAITGDDTLKTWVMGSL